ncbi:hypothetical protein CEP53_001373 [Fusarium sp. AF-6]|nr:hypothetical protein CEP53_001373 [Fusarium sp. AF-6]
MNLAKQWISNCQANHDRCNSSQPGQRVLPSRLISIDAPILGETTPQARLVLTDSLPKDETTEYCALSHSWGRSSPLRLLEDNLEGLLKSINTSLLSKNIQDALVVAHRLEFKYIWVDSICIIQNSAQDWRTEAAKMGDVYAGAFLTIAATGSNSGDGGCFHERDPVVFNRCEIGVSSVDELMPVRRYICQDDLTDLRHGVDIAPLNRRGWVLQERLLSRRILHFGSTMLYWECGQRAASEMNTNGFVYKQFPADFYGNFIPSSDLHPSGPPRGIKNRWNGIFQQFTPSSDFSLDDRIVWKQRSESFWKEPRRRTYSSWEDAFECGHRTALERLLASDPSSRAEYGFISPSHCWYEIVEAYTRSRLSFSTDRFDAISGIVKRIEQSTNRVCIAGLWEDTLATDLLWFAFEKPGERRIRERLPASREESLRRRDESIPEPRMAPSWSWMSVDAVISIDLLPSTADGRLTGTSLLTKCSASIENVDPKTGDRIWNAVQGKLEVEGPFQRCTPRTLNGKLCLTLDDVSDEIPLAAFFPDLDLFEEQLELWDLYCLSVLSLKTMDGDLLQLWKHSEEDIHGIVVRRADFGELFEEWDCINGELTVERWVRTILSVGYPGFNYDKEHISNAVALQSPKPQLRKKPKSYYNVDCAFLYADERMRDLRVGNKYRIGRKIGGGSFGDVYLGTNIISGEEIAIKLESVKAKHPQLEYEARVYKSLAGGVGIPFVRWYGTECDYNAMVYDLLGPSLEDLFNFCNRKFSLKTVLLLVDQLISRVEYIHAKSFIHRDIKPDNFLMGIGKRGNQVNAIDFGLAKKYRDPKTHFHIPYRENKNLTGTARYASINTHLGVEQSRRDDMESLGYIILYFTRGSLPWQGLKAATKKQKYDRIMEKKMTTPTEVLCRGLPNEFAIYLNYCRSLRFDDKPDYSYLRKIFRDLFVREGFQYDYVFDWTVYKYQKNAEATSKAAGGNGPAGGDRTRQ